ncbi:Na-translocating system protein MpsC family protein [Paenibacillus sp. MMO-177]|uniref:Na-translocating system protein MpsC family protein n=1 Tax=Paenibacillus sp. MMO-177 TaxID=3081289 RepID=UPI0030164A04
MNSQNRIEQFEHGLEKALAKTHKNIMGRGPIQTEVRIVGNAVFTRFETELIGSEKLLLGFLNENRHTYSYFEYLRGISIPIYERMFTRINKLLRITGMEFRVDDNYTFMLITLSSDLRLLIESGAANEPPNIEDTANLTI